MNPGLELLVHGQSCWMGDLTRRMIVSGGLAQRVAEEELRGVTSNPAIFAKALQQGDGYDRDLAHAAALGQSPQQIYEELVTTDIRNACAARETHAVVVVEDHASNGGLGDASCPELEIPCVSCFRISPRRF